MNTCHAHRQESCIYWERVLSDHYGVSLAVGREKFPGRNIVKNRNRLPRDMVESPSLEGFRAGGCGTWGHALVVAWNGWDSGILKVFSNLSNYGFL